MVDLTCAKDSKKRFAVRSISHQLELVVSALSGLEWSSAAGGLSGGGLGTARCQGHAKQPEKPSSFRRFLNGPSHYSSAMVSALSGLEWCALADISTEPASPSRSSRSGGAGTAAMGAAEIWHPADNRGHSPYLWAPPELQPSPAHPGLRGRPQRGWERMAHRTWRMRNLCTEDGSSEGCLRNRLRSDGSAPMRGKKGARSVPPQPPPLSGGQMVALRRVRV